ncbi:MAG: site-specific DNA-methyltransferase [Dinoroseobacter sp.]|nr:site-specific DNA-methyltransferase [Dinoroseobacter sp.]
MSSHASIDVIAPDRLDWRTPSELIPYKGNARTHSRKQIQQIASSIRQFGFTNPVLIDEGDGIIAGHGRVAAAQQLGLARIPVLQIAHLSAAERRAYIIADNKLAELAGWDQDILALEFEGLIELDFDLELTGFAIAEIDDLFEAQTQSTQDDSPDEYLGATHGPVVTKRGDIWALGPHRLLCGDARDADGILRLMNGQVADLIFTDPPYNVPINGHVLGKGQHHHAEFAFASGEMSQAEFTTFLEAGLQPAAQACKNGAIAFVCMDWRHMREMMMAGDKIFSELKNLCIWNKTNAGMGSFYRSKHELVFVWKIGTAAHTNAFGLGETGRYRTNVWDYAGANAFGSDRAEALNMHPTVKPTKMIEDAIKDCTRRGERVLDPFGGSGSTLIAAEHAGRVAHLIEYEPTWCDTILARFQRETGVEPIHVQTGACFTDVRERV